MTAGATESGGAGWAKTVVDGVAEADSGDPGSAEPAAGAGPGSSEATAPVDDDGHGEPADPERDGSPAADADDPGAGTDADDEADTASDADLGADGPEVISVEDLVVDLERVSAERDQYLDASRRLQAEFENYKKQVAKRETEARERANDSLIGELLPILDAFDGALASGTDDVAPMRNTFLDALGKQGLERIEPTDDPFDPNLHEAVLHDEDDEAEGPVVTEVMRAGYVWKGRVLRPAMVKTRG